MYDLVGTPKDKLSCVTAHFPFENQNQSRVQCTGCDYSTAQVRSLFKDSPKTLTSEPRLCLTRVA